VARVLGDPLEEQQPSGALGNRVVGDDDEREEDQILE